MSQAIRDTAELIGLPAEGGSKVVSFLFPFWRKKAKPLHVDTLQPYERRDLMSRYRKSILTIFGMFAFFYGAFFSITTTYFLIQMLIPLVTLLIFIIWSLPETGSAPLRLIEQLFWVFLIALICWPDYLALALPGLPWITAVRLVIVPLSITFLVGLSQSRDFRGELGSVINSIPPVWKMISIFAIISLFSTAFSSSPASTLSKFVVAMLYWIMIFFVACYVFSLPSRLNKLAFFLWIGAIFVCGIGLQEARHSVVPWVGHIPGFLKIENPAVERILAGTARAATGIYRVQSKFTTSLGLAEYLVFVTPFILHISFTSKQLSIRLCCLLTLPLVVWTIVKTDSRLGMVGLFSSVLLYILYWGVRRWHGYKDSLFGPATVFAFPGLVLGFLLSSLFIGRVRALIWGSGAQSFSTESRKQQVASGLPKIWSHPWGHGFGQGAETLGFTNGADILTIDSYYLAVALEIGIAGFIAYFGIFIWSIFTGSKLVIKVKDDETSFIGPCLITLINYTIIKSIFAQLENQPLVFIVLGATVATVYRLRSDDRVLAV